jgi:hypothetical protein
MASRNIVGHIDSHGEIHNDVLAIICPKRMNGFNEGWIAMAQPALMALANAKLSGEESRVLFAILSMLNFDNWVQLNQTGLSKTIKMRRQHLNRALKKLETENVLIRGPKVGSISTYRLNPNYGWKGTAKKHKEALKNKMEELGISVVNS